MWSLESMCGVIVAPLKWRHNERHGVSNHRRPDDCLPNRLFRRRSKKYQSSASLAFMRGIYRWPVDSPHKGPVTRKMFPFNDVIMTLPRGAVVELTVTPPWGVVKSTWVTINPLSPINSPPSHYLNQCWLTVNWTLKNKLHLTSTQSTELSTHDDASENVFCEMADILSGGRWVKYWMGNQHGIEDIAATTVFLVSSNTTIQSELGQLTYIDGKILKQNVKGAKRAKPQHASNHNRDYDLSLFADNGYESWCDKIK